jgi:hypothetical protein
LRRVNVIAARIGDGQYTVRTKRRGPYSARIFFVGGSESLGGK